jgi:hypothetical protein
MTRCQSLIGQRIGGWDDNRLSDCQTESDATPCNIWIVAFIDSEFVTHWFMYYQFNIFLNTSLDLTVNVVYKVLSNTGHN